MGDSVRRRWWYTVNHLPAVTIRAMLRYPWIIPLPFFFYCVCVCVCVCVCLFLRFWCSSSWNSFLENFYYVSGAPIPTHRMLLVPMNYASLKKSMTDGQSIVKISSCDLNIDQLWRAITTLEIPCRIKLNILLIRIWLTFPLCLVSSPASFTPALVFLPEHFLNK